MFQEDDEYEPSECAEAAFNFWYPDRITPAHPFFERYMIELQIELLACHKQTMFTADRRRAVDTLAQLKRKLACTPAAAGV